MADIVWTRGDTPLPLKVGMDLTGATVSVFLRDFDDATAPTYLLESTVLAGTSGALTVVSSSILAGRWQVETEVSQGGTVVATFPNDGTRQLLTVVADMGGDTPLPDEPDVILDGGAP